jgi:hypothetical protein
VGLGWHISRLMVPCFPGGWFLFGVCSERVSERALFSLLELVCGGNVEASSMLVRSWGSLVGCSLQRSVHAVRGGRLLQFWIVYLTVTGGGVVLRRAVPVGGLTVKSI